MYDASDPRTALAGAADDLGIAAARYLDLMDEAPGRTTSSGSRAWTVRGQNFVIDVAELVPGDELHRPADQDEYVVLVGDPDGALTLRAHGEEIDAEGRILAIMPPGGSSLVARSRILVARVFDARTSDLADAAINAADYCEPRPRVAPVPPRPPVPADAGIRLWWVDDIPPEDGRFGRIFRTGTLMVNYMYPIVGPRDPRKMSPHHHDDFEQGSLALAGAFDHHVRTPWGTDLTAWREDEHVHVSSPSLAIIPPPTEHTTRATDAGVNLLIDVFSPPREDFLGQPGWVINADDYARRTQGEGAFS